VSGLVGCSPDLVPNNLRCVRFVPGVVSAHDGAELIFLISRCCKWSFKIQQVPIVSVVQPWVKYCN
jgi:hypothetical protein